jgi:hypothetical protein
VRAVAGRGRAAPRAGPGVGKLSLAVRVGGDDRRAECVSEEVKGVGVRVREVSAAGPRSCLAAVAAVLVRRILLCGKAAVRRWRAA